MTGRQVPSMTDERLDRLIDQLLADRAEDVASVALPADAVAERIAARLRSGYRWRGGGLVLVAAVLMLLVGMVAAAVVGSRPSTPSPTPTTFDCEDKAQEFSGEQPYPIALRDETGFVAACRQLTSDEALASRESFGPPLDSLDSSTVEITIASADGLRLLVVWIIVGCDVSARVDLTTAPPNGLDLVVNRQQVGGCAPGTALRALEITFDELLAPGDVAGRVIQAQIGP